MPRPAHPLWREVQVLVPTGPAKQYPDVECLHCRLRIQNAQPSRALLSHIVACPSISDEEKDKWRRYRDLEMEKRCARQSLGKRARDDDETSDDAAPSELDNETFQYRIALMFYSTKLAFRQIENLAFRSAILQGRPDHLTLPTRAELGGSLLEKVYTREREETIDVWKNEKFLVLETDERIHSSDECIVNFYLKGPNSRSLYYKSEEIDDEEEADEYAALILNVIDEIESLVGKGKVAAVTTNSTSAMHDAMDILEAKRPGLLCGGCGTRAALLLDQSQSTTRFVGKELDSTLADLIKIAARLGFEERERDLLHDEIGRFVAMKEEWTAEERETHSRYSPISWWGTHIAMFPNLAKIARRVFCVSTSSAAKRAKSTHDYIHSKLRHLLCFETLIMLVFIYTNTGDKGQRPARLSSHQ
ncbi:hypothetical protein DVH05_004159 [Phytophthora capsici]|nr:hypothetical protein DVH05_004159 [Phytophthora capsici]